MKKYLLFVVCITVWGGAWAYKVESSYGYSPVLSTGYRIDARKSTVMHHQNAPVVGSRIDVGNKLEDEKYIDFRSFPYYQLLSDDLVFRVNKNQTVTVLWQGKEIQTLSVGNGLIPLDEGREVLKAPFVPKGAPAAGQGDVKGVVAGESAAQSELAQVRAELAQAREQMREMNSVIEGLRKERDREREEHKKEVERLKAEWQARY